MSIVQVLKSSELTTILIYKFLIIIPICLDFSVIMLNFLKLINCFISIQISIQILSITIIPQQITQKLKMEQWKAAYKQIFGKTPTKRDCSVAPSSVRAELSPEKQQQKGPRSQKRTRLSFKRSEQADDDEFTTATPAKQRRRNTSPNPPSAAMSSAGISKAEAENLQLLLRPPHNNVDPFLSPVKRWTGFLASPSRSASKRLQRAPAHFSPGGSSAALLKTPSPAKFLRRPIAFTNIGNLLTPEKLPALETEEVEDEKELDEENQPPEEEKLGSGGTTANAEQKKKQQPRKPKKDNNSNFVAINLRRRRFAPISKMRNGGRDGKRGKKFWRGKKFGRR
jgi:hypothetical protein